MNATKQLHDLGQSLWLDNITRDLLKTGTLKRYIKDLSVTGLTSNPTIFENAIRKSGAYDADIRKKRSRGMSGEALFFDLALEDLTAAADLFRPIHERTLGVDLIYYTRAFNSYVLVQYKRMQHSEGTETSAGSFGRTTSSRKS